ncbi:hypothetical protein PACTADRAFT_3013 [Pachysolen tannophilus NRRL Y-2460]|uniref:Uncharacterized protein n=1 Tax=Pachysolen tannophilus NRRL Y-2460 TaxID=669874 RepID=A0A1E4TU90_PACTA|nr:hypothetical protein PACTADRAFT_3013 [Pachysolen tannophilus NRRL Y-2460]
MNAAGDNNNGKNRYSSKLSNIPILQYQPSSAHNSTIYNNESRPSTAISNSQIMDRRRKTYENLSEIDWSYEYELERKNKKFIDTQITTVFARIYYNNLKWIVLILTGLILGPIAIIIDIASKWLRDFKYGLCYKNDKVNLFVPRLNCGEDDWIDWSHFIFNFINPDNTIIHYFNNYFFYLASSVLLAWLAALVVKTQPFTKLSGISELKIILSGFIINDFMNFKVAISKTIGLILVVASGISVGKEGPLVHIAACITHFIIDRFPYIKNNEAIKREIISASTSAGIGVAFNAPIGGVLFTLEQISSFFPIDKLMWNSFVCATISVMILQVLHPFSSFFTTQLFIVSGSENWIRYEFFPFALLGLLCGWLGLNFNKLNVGFAEIRNKYIDKSTRLKIMEVVILAFVSALVSYPFALSRLPLSGLASVLFTKCPTDENSKNISDLVLNTLCLETTNSEDIRFPLETLSLLLMTAIQLFILSSYSYGTFIPGGILMPSLAIGATVGRFLGTLIEFLQFKYPTWFMFANCKADLSQCITPSSYAVVGAASFLTSVTKMSVSVVVILFELTGALNYVIPIMIGVLLSKFIAHLSSNKSCYELWLSLQKYPYLTPGNDEELIKPLLSVVECRNFLKPVDDLIILYEESNGNNFEYLKNLLSTHKYQGFPVLNNAKDKNLLGWCSSYELKQELDKVKEIEGVTLSEQFFTFLVPRDGDEKYSLNPILSTDLFVFSSNLSILTIYSIFNKLCIRVAIFCYPGKGQKLRGILTKKDLIEIVELKDKYLMDVRNYGRVQYADEDVDEDNTNEEANGANLANIANQANIANGTHGTHGEATADSEESDSRVLFNNEDEFNQFEIEDDIEDDRHI